MKTLYWLTDDLILNDNPALSRACESEQLSRVYCLDPRWCSPGRHHLASMGPHRWRFLRQALSELASSVTSLGRSLEMVRE